MRYSSGCRAVLRDGDFLERDYRLIEEVVFWCPPAKVLSVVQQTDPGGKHRDFEWFLIPIRSMFRNDSIGDAEWARAICSGPEFWGTYDYLAQWVEEDFYASDLELIAEMALSMGEVKACMGRSKPNLRYLYKVWRGTKMPTSRELNAPGPGIENHEVKTHD
jgi:hypothetical protein